MEWKEEDHPRDNEGKFTNGMKKEFTEKEYKDLRKKYEEVRFRVGNYVGKSSKKDVIEIMNLLENPEDIFLLNSSDIPTDRITKEIVENAVNKRKIEKEKREESEKKFSQWKKEQEEKKKETIQQEGITEKQYEREREAENYRNRKRKENLRIQMELEYEPDHGYSERHNKSIRAVKAELNGKYPATEAARLLGTTTEKIRKVLGTSEWHHSSGSLFNQVDYYDINKLLDIADMGISEYENDDEYKEAIKQWKLLTGRNK